MKPNTMDYSVFKGKISEMGYVRYYSYTLHIEKQMKTKLPADG